MLKVKANAQNFQIICGRCGTKPEGQGEGNWVVFATKCTKCSAPLKIKLEGQGDGSD